METSLVLAIVINRVSAVITWHDGETDADYPSPHNIHFEQGNFNIHTF